MRLWTEPRFRRARRQLLSAVWSQLAPPTCPGCGRGADRSDLVCSRCSSRFERMPIDGCSRCGEPLALTGRCIKDHRPLIGIDRRLTAFRYRGTGGAIVRRFKFSADPCSKAFLVDRLSVRLQLQGRALRGAELVPVPTHPRKRRRRRRDPATELADALGERLALPVRPAALRRIVDTLPQADPRVTSRAENVARAFVARPGILHGRSILLIDDVSTSGSTARACAKALQDVHPVPIWLVTAALG